jgi:hypothetical protein
MIAGQPAGLTGAAVASTVTVLVEVDRTAPSMLAAVTFVACLWATASSRPLPLNAC